MAYAGFGIPCSPLSRTYQSSQLLTPQDLTRITIDQRKYAQYQSDVVQSPPSSGRVPGGAPIHYGEHPILLERHHPLHQFYSNTPLQLSAVRAHDQIVPKPLSSNTVVHNEIHLPFPAEHPYSSHKERFRVFPDTRRDDVHVGGDPAREIPLCRVVDRAQFKGWRREEVTLHRPYTAHLEVGQMPPWHAAIALQKKHYRSPTYPFILPLSNIGRPHTSTLPPVTPRTREGLSELQRSLMRTSYQDHYLTEESGTTPDVLVVETPAPLQAMAAGGEGEEEGGVAEGGKGQQEEPVEEFEERASAGKEEEGEEVPLGKEEDCDGKKAEEGEEGVQDEREGQPHGASCLVLPNIQTSPAPSTLPSSHPVHRPPPTLPRNISSSRRYVELCERFSRSEAMRRYHRMYPDQLPDLREATSTGRRHIINGYHAYFYH